MDWHTLSPENALKELGSTESGLSENEVKGRLLRYGPNSLPELKTDSTLKIFLRQFASPIIYILLASAAIILLFGETIDSIVIMAVLVINAIVGAIQEGKAQNTLAALRNMVRTTAVCIRAGKEVVVSSEEIVPGDIIILAEGNKVPADARILEARALKADEAALTGESESVGKHADTMPQKDLQASDKRNMVFRGTYIVGGDARAVVTATGLDTVIGGISRKLGEVNTDVPLKANIEKLSKIIIILVLSLCALIFAIGILQGISLEQMFVISVAIAVSAIPEGLPVVVTIVLAAGMYRMSKQNALVRKLQAVEALGQAKVIAVDKTGTITLNQMAVEKLWTGGRMFDVEVNGYEPRGAIMSDGSVIEPLERPDILLSAKIAALTATASVAYAKDTDEWKRISGDPTEAALLVFSKKIGFEKDALEREHKRALDLPFSSGTRYHAAINEIDGSMAFSAAGAPETILENSSRIWKEGKITDMTQADRSEIRKTLVSMASLGLRVVALGINFEYGKETAPEKMPSLCFVGIAGISDSVRTDARAALERAQEAGVKIVMITGDYPETAKAIAGKVGIYKEGDRVITGQELAELSSEEIAEALPNTSVFARVAPEDKLKIVEAYRKRGEVIAMTGDGVNDALSLAAADLGVAMGRIGTEVAKEAADIVLLDDNFGSIVSAIEEGRNVYRSIKKVILYLFSTSMGEILTISSAMILGFPIPLLATQIIWMNFVTDGFLVAALALEPKEKNLLSPSRRKSVLIDRLMIERIALISIAMTACALFLFIAYLDRGFVVASTVALTTLSICQWYNTLNCRTENRSIFRKGSFSNPYLLGSLVLVVGLQILAVYAPPLQKILRTAPIGLNDWFIIAGISLAVIAAEELRKAYVRLSGKRHMA